MNPLIRIVVVVGALAGVCLVAQMAWPAVETNLTARRSWSRTVGEVRAMSGRIEFEIGQEPNSLRAFADVEHTWGLTLFQQVPLFLDPVDPSRVKPAGFLQMWLVPAGLSVFLVLFLAVAWMAARYGSQATGVASQAEWMFTPSPGPLPGGISLHTPGKQWQIVLGWSLLGVALAIIPIFAKSANPVSRIGGMTLGSAFALALWGFAWHTKTLQVSADDQGVRMTSVLGWRNLPWALVRSVEDQDIFTTYYNGNMRMWELPFPGSDVRVIAFTDERGRTLMSFGPDLEPRDSLKRLFELCTERTGLKLHRRTIAIRY